MHRTTLSRAAAAALTVACAAATALPTASLGAQITNGSTLVFTGVWLTQDRERAQEREVA
jgi:hypothetical protein